MTPHQLNLAINEFYENKKQDQEEKLRLTYYGAYWQRVKKMPSLKQVLGIQEVKKQMTPEEMLRKVMQLNKAYGGTKEEVE